MALKLVVKPAPAKPTLKFPSKIPMFPPGQMRSMGGERVEGALEPPQRKNIVQAKDMRSDEIYSNVHPGTVMDPYYMIRTLGHPEVVVAGKRVKDTSKVRITFYARGHRDWLTCDVPLDYLVTTEELYLQHTAKPIAADPAVKAKRTEHLKQFHFKKGEGQAKPLPPATKKDGKRAFKGTLGTKKVLIDAGDGSVVGDQAKPGKLEIVARSAASPYAAKIYEKAWAEAK